MTRAAKRRISAERLSNPSFADYLHQIEAPALLDAAAEKRLGHLLINGRPASGYGPMTAAAYEARQGLITSNLRLVVVIAACYANQGVPLQDIVSAGNIGLIRAVDKYQPGRARFATHATWWIREACSRYVMAHGPMIYLPRDVLASKRRLTRVAQAAEAAGETLDADELMARAALVPGQVQRALGAQDVVLSLDKEMTSGDGDTTTLADTIADDRDTLETRAAESDAIRELYRHLSALCWQERQVLTLRYGLGERDGVTMTNADVATALGLNREKVRKLESQALLTLRAAYDPEQLRQALLFRVV